MYELPRIKDLPADDVARILGDPVQPLLPALPADLQVSIDESVASDDAYVAAGLLSEFETAA